MMMKNYHIVCKGSESTIFKVSPIDNYVMKISNNNNIKHITKEINAIKLLRKHPNIINYIKFNKNNIIYFPYYPQDLYSYIEKKNKIPYSECINIFYKIIDAIDFIHSLGLIHCDIKPENILLDEKLEPKIIDFGHLTISKSFIQKGTLNYNSPEMCLGRIYDYRTDLWSLGILLYLMYYGCFPFYEKKESIRNQIIYFSKKIPKKNPNIYKIIKSLLIINPEERKSLRSIKEMKCFDKFPKNNYYREPIHVPENIMNEKIIKILTNIGWNTYSIIKQLSKKINKTNTDIMVQRSYYILNQMCN
jgi:serine/threonine protein kinase